MLIKQAQNVPITMNDRCQPGGHRFESYHSRNRGGVAQRFRVPGRLSYVSPEFRLLSSAGRACDL